MATISKLDVVVAGCCTDARLMRQAVRDEPRAGKYATPTFRRRVGGDATGATSGGQNLDGFPMLCDSLPYDGDGEQILRLCLQSPLIDWVRLQPMRIEVL
jgi:hypothetical protein